MNKLNLVKAMANKVENGTQCAAEEYLNAFSDVVIETLKDNKDDKVTLPGLGSFKVKKCAARKGTVRFGENAGSEWTTPEHYELTFSFTKAIKTI